MSLCVDVHLRSVGLPVRFAYVRVHFGSVPAHLGYVPVRSRSVQFINI